MKKCYMALLIIGIFLLSGCRFTVDFLPGRNYTPGVTQGINYETIASLETGMPLAEVEAILGRAPALLTETFGVESATWVTLDYVVTVVFVSDQLVSVSFAEVGEAELILDEELEFDE